MLEVVINFVEKNIVRGDAGAEHHLWGVGTDVEIPRRPSWRLQSATFRIRGRGEYPIWVESALARLQGKIFRAIKQISGGSRPTKDCVEQALPRGGIPD